MISEFDQALLFGVTAVVLVGTLVVLIWQLIRRKDD